MLQWSQQSTEPYDLIDPSCAMHCTAFSGNYDGGYTNTVRITVNGKVYSFQHRGLSWVSYGLQQSPSATS
jgi:hypothetical protein